MSVNVQSILDTVGRMAQSVGKGVSEPMFDNTIGPDRFRNAVSRKTDPEAAAENLRQQDAYGNPKVAERDYGPVDAADEAADVAADRMTADTERDEEKEEKQNDTATEYDDPFYAAFNAYSDDNLGGMGLYDFMTVDPNSAEDRAAWEAMVNSDEMSGYYSGLLDRYGGFDAMYDQAVANDLDTVMASQELQRQYLNSPGGDTADAFFQGVSHDGFVPDVSGDQWRADEMMNMYYENPDYNAATLEYLFGMDALANGGDAYGLEADPYALAKMNDYLALGNMQFGYGDGYSTKVGDVPEQEGFNAVDPEAYDRALEEQLSAIPGYSLPDLGVRAMVYDKYGAGYQMRPGVEDAYAQYYAGSGE